MRTLSFVEPVNVAFYDHHFADPKAIHRHPNVHTIRCDLWYFRPDRQPGRLLDYGFGYGQEALYFAQGGYTVHGLDVSGVAVRRFQDILHNEHPTLPVTLDLIDPAAVRLPYHDAFFDYIHSNQVIYHLPSLAAIDHLLREWQRVLKPGGKLMCSTIGPENTIVTDGTEIAPNLYELAYQTPHMAAPITMRSYLFRDEAAIRAAVEPYFVVDEVGWFTNHYRGIDGFHYQVLAQKR